MIIHNPYIPGIDKIFFDVQSSNRQNVQFETMYHLYANCWKNSNKKYVDLQIKTRGIQR